MDLDALLLLTVLMADFGQCTMQIGVDHLHNLGCMAYWRHYLQCLFVFLTRQYGCLAAMVLPHVKFCLFVCSWQVHGASSCMGSGCHTPSSVPMHADILQSCSGQLFQSFD